MNRSHCRLVQVTLLSGWNTETLHARAGQGLETVGHVTDIFIFESSIHGQCKTETPPPANIQGQRTRQGGLSDAARLDICSSLDYRSIIARGSHETLDQRYENRSLVE